MLFLKGVKIPFDLGTKFVLTTLIKVLIIRQNPGLQSSTLWGWISLT